MESENMKKFYSAMAGGFFGLAVGLIGSVELGSIEFHSGILMCLLCLGAFGFFSWLSGLWYRV